MGIGVLVGKVGGSRGNIDLLVFHPLREGNIEEIFGILK